MKTRKFYVLWTYIANHSEKCMEVEASSADEAIEKVLDICNSKEFAQKAKVYAFTTKPTIYDGREAMRAAKELDEKRRRLGLPV